MYCRRLRARGNDHDGAQPDPTLNVHICVPQIRAEILLVGGGGVEQYDAGVREWGVHGEGVAVHHGRRCHADHAGVGIGVHGTGECHGLSEARGA